MLRALEIDRPEATGHTNPAALVFIALPEAHAARAAGRAPWDRSGPCYDVIDGELKYLGHFDKQQRSLLERISSKSKTYVAVRNSFITQHDQERYLAIILKARQISLRKYRKPFVVVLWDVHIKGERNAGGWIANKLQENNVPLLQLSASLPILEADDYYIPIDGHPNGRGYALVARELDLFLAKHFPDSLNTDFSDRELVKRPH